VRLALYTYFRSSASYRVRIALHLKGLAFEPRYVHLLRKEQTAPAYRDLNPQGLVPTLVDGSTVLTQSLAIIEYLEETHPEPPLLPATAAERAQVRSLAYLIACDTQPLQNLRVLRYLGHELGVDEMRRTAWIIHWIRESFIALEARLAKSPLAGAYCWGDRPGLADICLVPQVYNARRFDCELRDFPRIVQISDRCLELPTFQAASPDQQDDRE
jgi:maleylacetoacetate isomerase